MCSKTALLQPLKFMVQVFVMLLQSFTVCSTFAKHEYVTCRVQRSINAVNDIGYGILEYLNRT